MLSEQARKTLMSSSQTEYETPDDFFECWNRRFKFTMDVCATQNNTKCETYITPEMDALTQTWDGKTCWMNPPYGREIGKWVKKACDEWEQGDCTVVALLPSRTDTKWWHEYIMDACEVHFVVGRIKFLGGEHPAPFPSAVVVWHSRCPNQTHNFRHPEIGSWWR